MRNGSHTGPKNQKIGKGFEHIFEITARLNGILPLNMPLAARRIGLKRLIQVKSPFDYVIMKNGRSAFIDCKTFNSVNITYSQLTTHQVEILARIQETNQVAGYVCWMRRSNMVYFIPGKTLAMLNPGQSLDLKNEKCLGSIEKMDLNALFDYPLTTTLPEPQQLRQ